MTSLISLIQKTTNLKTLKQIHAQLLISENIINNPRLLSHFISTIVHKTPINLDYSYQILNNFQNPTLLALNAFIRFYSKSSNPEKSFHFYEKIQAFDQTFPDNYTFNFLIGACAQILDFKTGICVHCDLIKHGFENDPHVQCGLIHMYAELGCMNYCHDVFGTVVEPGMVCQTTMLSACVKRGDVCFARQLFDEMPHKDTIAWNSMIAGYAQCGDSREALDLFHLMQIEGVKINEVSMVLVLSACAQLGALNHGKWAHMYIVRNKIPMNVTLGTALVDMYAKCGNIDKAMEIFWGMNERNVYTWTSTINGLAINGAGEECLKLFSQMKQEGVLPNEVTFVAVLKGCIVAEQVDEGRRHFEAMRRVYGLQYGHEHYGCMVDLYGKAGRLNDALSFIKSMPIKPHGGAWTALLSASRVYKDEELGQLAYTNLLELNTNDQNPYVPLTNINEESKSGDSMDQTRREMIVKGVKTIPGCSVLEIGDEVHGFLVGDRSHPRYNEIKSMLMEVTEMLKSAGDAAIAEEEEQEVSKKEKIVLKDLRACLSFH